MIDKKYFELVVYNQSHGVAWPKDYRPGTQETKQYCINRQRLLVEAEVGRKHPHFRR